MSKSSIPNFPRGFLFSATPISAPPAFIEGPLLPNFYVHPWTVVETAGDNELFVIGIGSLIPTHDIENPVEELLAALKKSETTFFDLLSFYSGRYAVIYGALGDIRVVNDATAMQSVFYSLQGRVVASHPLLVERALGGSIEQTKIPFRYGYPGNRTPYTRTRILTANTYYWLSANVVRRFWPIVHPSAKTPDQAATILLEDSTTALKRMSYGRTVQISLTAGLDSRTVLAIALHSGIEFTTYTYGHDHGTKIDREIARELSRQFGIQHKVIPTKVEDLEVKRRLLESHYQPHHHGVWVRALKDYFNDVNSVAVLGNLLEIGRSNTANERTQMTSPPLTAAAMTELHLQRMGKARRAEVFEFGFERFKSISESAFQDYINETGFDIQAGILDPFDQFYWEHRMSTWQGYAMGERDYYATPFIPFNTRRIFESMLGVAKDDRHNDTTVYSMLRRVDPSLLEIPINPKQWPA